MGSGFLLIVYFPWGRSRMRPLVAAHGKRGGPNPPLGPPLHTYSTMYSSASFILTVAYPNSLVRSQRVRVIDVAL